MHFRTKYVASSAFSFKCGPTDVDYASSYRYLGCYLNEFRDFTHTAQVLAESAGQAIESIINKHKWTGGINYKVYKTLYDSCVQPIMDYCGDVWGFKNYAKCNSVQNRAISAFIGVHIFASTLAIHGDTPCIPPIIRSHLELLRFWHRIVTLPSS